jgi:hypothetical protein
MTNSFQQGLARAIIAFFLIIILFICIELLPLYFGPKHFPFDQLWREFTARLPRILLIAVAASLFLGIGKQPFKKS